MLQDDSCWTVAVVDAKETAGSLAILHMILSIEFWQCRKNIKIL